MNVTVCSSNEITIHGDIKNVVDYRDLKKVMQDILREGGKELTVNMPDACSIISSVIGFFLKLVYHDGVNLTLVVWDKRLYELLSELKLSDVFNVKYNIANEENCQ